VIQAADDLWSCDEQRSRQTPSSVDNKRTWLLAFRISIFAHQIDANNIPLCCCRLSPKPALDDSLLAGIIHLPFLAYSMCGLTAVESERPRWNLNSASKPS
jgi:hypothetical protein